MAELILQTKTFLPFKVGNEEILNLVHDTRKSNFYLIFNQGKTKETSDRFINEEEFDLEQNIFERTVTYVANERDKEKDKQYKEFIAECVPIIKDKLGIEETIDKSQEDKEIKEIINIDPDEKEKVMQKILSESKLKDEKRIRSILDKDFPRPEEVITIINNYNNKKDLAKQFLEVIPLYYDSSNIWWRWKHKNNRWKITDEVDVLNLIELCSQVNIIKPKERTEILNALKQAARKNKPEIPRQSWIQFNDEIVDLKTGDRFQATPKYFVTNPIPYDLGRNDETPTMDKIFEEWVGKDYVRTLYEIIAYCLLCDYPLHRLFCFIGGGMNGKSCFLTLLRRFVGGYNVCSTELDTLINSRFEVTRLHKKLVCQMGETNFNQMNKTSIIKKLTGNDLIGFEYKNKTPFEDTNYAKIIIATNNLPTTSDKTIGFYRRWMIIDFPNQFTEKKDILEEIPLEEYNNLAMKCIGILFDLLSKKEFHKEGDIEERAKRYEDKSDPLQKFIKVHILEDLNSHISKADFHKKFNSWCKENRFREMAENTIGKKMKEKSIDAGRKYVDWLHDGKGGQMKVWLGINWKNQD